MQKHLPKKYRLTGKKTTMPTFIEPMKAILVDKPFDGPDWLFESKLDGFRCLAFKNAQGKITLKSRNNKILNDSYPEIVQALQKQSVRTFIIDGEICAIKKGLSNFQALQNRLHNFENAEIRYYVFDLLFIDGYDIRSLPLVERKAILEHSFYFNEMFIYNDHLLENGVKYFKQACALHWEGLIAKKINSRYVSVRSRDWQKLKCVHEQEFIILGYTDPGGSREYFGAILLGYYDEQKNLVYAGKVGTGFSQATLKMLGEKFYALKTKKFPLLNFTIPKERVHWIKPKLVGEFKFTEWTEDGKLRHGVFLGLRDDKKASEVIREMPQQANTTKKVKSKKTM